MEYYVYRLRNVINGKRYFGKGKGERWRYHFERAKSRMSAKSLIVNAIRKHGAEAFELTMMLERLAEAEAYVIETFYIRRFRTNARKEYEPGVWGYGYNMTDGGEGNSGRIGYNKGKTFSETARRNMSLAKLGKKQPNIAKALRGKKQTAEVIEKRTARLRGVPLSESHREALRQGNLGKKRSAETCERIAASRRGKAAANKGVPWSEQKRANYMAAITTERTLAMLASMSTIVQRLEAGERRDAIAKEFDMSVSGFNRRVHGYLTSIGRTPLPKRPPRRRKA